MCEQIIDQYDRPYVEKILEKKRNIDQTSRRTFTESIAAFTENQPPQIKTFISHKKANRSKTYKNVIRLQIASKKNQHFDTMNKNFMMFYFYPQSISVMTYISLSLYQILIIIDIHMNFDKNTPIDTLLGRLLAFIIMFQKRIEFLKCKLAGNQQFHTRLAFQMLDTYKRNQISVQDIYQALSSANFMQLQANIAFFVRRYSKNNGITYEQFLKLISPKGNKSLSQRMMIRTFKKGAIQEDYIFVNLLELISLYIKMSVITENIRKNMQYNEDLTHLQIIQFFHIRIRNSHDLISFINLSEPEQERQEQYDIEPSDAIFLSYHINSGNQIHQFDDSDIKEIVCPIDMNFQKHSQSKFNPYSYTGNNFKDTANQKFNPQKTSANFLGKTYQKIYQKEDGSSRQSKIQRQGGNMNIQGLVVNKNRMLNNYNVNVASSKIDHYSQDHSYRGMYIDNFTKSNINDRLQINKYAQISQQGRSRFEHFQDDLQNNSSLSRQSAFDRS